MITININTPTETISLEFEGEEEARLHELADLKGQTIEETIDGIIEAFPSVVKAEHASLRA
jgi:hypothetical protein